MANRDDSRKKSFIFHSDYIGEFEDLTDGEFRAVVTAMSNYTESGELPDFDDRMLKTVFLAKKTTIDRDREKWEKAREAMSEAGKKGMESRWGKKEPDDS